MQPANSRALIALDLDGKAKFQFADCRMDGILPKANDAVERIGSGNLHALYYLEKASPLGSVVQPETTRDLYEDCRILHPHIRGRSFLQPRVYAKPD